MTGTSSTRNPIRVLGQGCGDLRRSAMTMKGLFSFSLLLALWLAGCSSKPAHDFESELNDAVQRKDVNALSALFYFSEVAPNTKTKLKPIIEDIFSWDQTSVDVIPFSKDRSAEFAATSHFLNGEPIADVSFKNKATEKGYTMLAGSTPNGIRVLLPSKAFTPSQSQPNTAEQDAAANP
jgi:hypothetical protein